MNAKLASATPTKRGRYDRGLTPSERAREQRGLLIAAALDVLAKGGGRVNTVDELVRQAHSSKSTFYSHFDTLEELYRAVARDAEHSFLAEVVGTVGVEVNTPFEALRLASEAWCQVAAFQRTELRALELEGRAALQRVTVEVFSGAVLAARRTGLFSAEPDALAWKCFEACAVELASQCANGADTRAAAIVLTRAALSLLR